MAETRRPIVPKKATNELNLNEILRVVLNYRRLIGVVTFIFVIAAYIHCLRSQRLYQAVTTVRLPQSKSADGLAQMMPDSMGDQMETDIEICQSENVAARAVSELEEEKRMPVPKGVPPEITYRNLLGEISVTNILKSDVLSIRAMAPDPGFAADLANAWAKCFIDAELDLSHQAASARGDFLEQQVKKMSAKLADPGLRLSDESKTDQAIYDQLLSNLREARMAESNQSLGVVVVDAALPENSPVRPQKRKILEVGFFLGLFVGFQIALLLSWLGDRVSGLEKLNAGTGLPNYAVIPDFHQYLQVSSGVNIAGVKSLIHDPVFGGTEYLESFRLLRTNLSYAQTEKSIETVAILSPVRGEGKTLANANLALSMAQVGKKVLLVDADLRNPGLCSLFGVEPKGGLGLPAALAGQGPWKSMVVASGIEHLDLLPNRAVVPNATELLSGEFMKRFIEETRKAYDFVVFDGAPVLHLTDSLILATLVDGVVLLARSGSTRNKELAEAAGELASVKARVVGTVLNAVKPEKGIVGRILPNAQKRNTTTLSEKTEGKRFEKIFPPLQWVLMFFKWFLP